jgi:hypothetical protein
MKTSVWFLAMAAASMLGACGKDISPDDNEITASSALSAVHGCIKQKNDCNAMAMTGDEKKACAEQLHSCLGSLARGRHDVDGGLPIPPVGIGMLPPGAVTPPSGGGLPDVDAGLPVVDPSLPGLPGLPGLDAGGAAGAPVVPVAPGDIVKTLKECLTTLRDCLSASASDPMTCATQVMDCIKAGI